MAALTELRQAAPGAPISKVPTVGGWDTVVFLPGTWEASFRRHLLEAFSRRMRGYGKVLCVERPPSVWKVLAGKVLRAGASAPRFYQRQDNLFVAGPTIAMHPFLAEYFPGLPNLNERLLRGQLKTIFKKAGFGRKPLVTWLFHPFQLQEAGLCRSDVLVYDCYDRYDEPPQPIRTGIKNEILRREKALLEKADVILTVSRALQQWKRTQGYESHRIPNAVDWTLFRGRQSGAAALPEDLASIPSPRLGFIGHMSSRIDFELLEDLAQRRPRDSIVLVGSLSEKGIHGAQAAALERLRRRSNVYILGPRPYEQLPDYLKGFDVCLVPYADTVFNQYSSPLKIYEYLASGKPVVSVANPEIEAFKDVVAVVHDRSGFSAAIDEELERRNDGSRREERLRRAELNSWDVRSDNIFELLRRRKELRS